jgi:hypothetical protein
VIGSTSAKAGFRRALPPARLDRPARLTGWPRRCPAVPPRQPRAQRGAAPVAFACAGSTAMRPPIAPGAVAWATSRWSWSVAPWVRWHFPDSLRVSPQGRKIPRTCGCLRTGNGGAGLLRVPERWPGPWPRRDFAPGLHAGRLQQSAPSTMPRSCRLQWRCGHRACRRCLLHQTYVATLRAKSPGHTGFSPLSMRR